MTPLKSMAGIIHQVIFLFCQEKEEVQARPPSKREDHTVIVVSEPSSRRASPENNEESHDEDPAERNKDEMRLVCLGLW